MTQAQAELQALVNSLAMRHSIPADGKLKRNLARLERMANFYEEKIPSAPEKQAFLFRDFSTALFYSMTIIKMYQRLTMRIAELAEDIEYETGSDSKG